jgi:hypothetical protein
VQVANGPHGVVGGRDARLHPGAAVARNLPAWVLRKEADGVAGVPLQIQVSRGRASTSAALPSAPEMTTLAVGLVCRLPCRDACIAPSCRMMESMQETTTGPQVTGRCCVRMAVLAFFGVPHGATDHLVAASIFRRSFPRCWLLVFVLVRKRAAVRLSASG